MRIDISQLQEAIANELEEYADQVFYATEEGLDDAAKILKDKLKANTPKGETQKLNKSWKIKKYTLARYVHNTKMVDGKNGKIPLINILEYSAIRGKPFVKATFSKSVDSMAKAIVNHVKNIRR